MEVVGIIVCLVVFLTEVNVVKTEFLTPTFFRRTLLTRLNGIHLFPETFFLFSSYISVGDSIFTSFLHVLRFHPLNMGGGVVHT